MQIEGGLRGRDGCPGTLTRADEPGFAQVPQRFSHGMAAYGETPAKRSLGRQVRADRMLAADDLLLQDADDAFVQRTVLAGSRAAASVCAGACGLGHNGGDNLGDGRKRADETVRNGRQLCSAPMCICYVYLRTG